MRPFKSVTFRLAALGLSVICFLRAADGPLKLEVAHTERVDFPEGGVLRIRNATGQVKVEGWDRPDAEITTIKSNKGDLTSNRERAKAQANLDRVKVSAGRKGDELTVNTEFPKRLAFPGIHYLHGNATTFDLEYRIRVPRSTRLVIDHNEGEVWIDDIAANIQVRTRQGEIIVHLAGEAPRDIDAKSASGSVNSDFPGEARRCCLLGHRFLAKNSSAPQKLDLQIGYGDIFLLKLHNPHPSAALAP